MVLRAAGELAAVGNAEPGVAGDVDVDAGFDDQVAKFAADNPLFPQAQANATASAPQEPPQGAPAGTRMAPDGRFYAPDPARPGKFLMVR